MGRVINLTGGADAFVQGLAAENIEITLNSLGGDDTIQLNRTDDLGGGNVVNAGTGADAVVNLKEFGNVIRLGDGNDTYIGRGFSAFASDPGDQVFAGAGNDLIAVETFHSSYRGDVGNDTFVSVGWQNTFNGGQGTDTISYAARDDDFAQGSSGVTVDLAQGFTQTGANRREFLLSIENAIGSGNDDSLIGNGKANRLEGAGGFDTLRGNGGADRFVFAKLSDCRVNAEAFDLVEDFNRAQGDRISLNNIDAKAGVSGNQAFAFIGEAAFGNVKGQLRVEVFTDALLVQGDVNGDGRADFQFAVVGAADLRATDFLL
jgi:Ca2+-binding RTX toxin-like protein